MMRFRPEPDLQHSQKTAKPFKQAMIGRLLINQVPGEPAQILLADGLVDGCAAPDTLPVVVGGVRPPVRLHLHVPKSKGFNILNYDK